MNIVIYDNETARITPTGGRIRDRYTGRTYSEVTTTPLRIYRYEDADSVTYESSDVSTLPEEVRLVFDQVSDLIIGLASKYDALADLKSMPDVNIGSLFGLADSKGVTEADMQSVIMQVVMLKTDIEAKLPRSWYDVWNGNLKPYLLEKLTHLN